MYKNLTTFYLEQAPTIKRELSMGIERVNNPPYDVNLNIDEAFQQYANCDRETARKINEVMGKVKIKSELYIASLREQYQGDLVQQLGYDREEYKRRGEERNQFYKKMVEALTSSFQERYPSKE